MKPINVCKMKPLLKKKTKNLVHKTIKIMVLPNKESLTIIATEQNPIKTLIPRMSTQCLSGQLYSPRYSCPAALIHSRQPQ